MSRVIHSLLVYIAVETREDQAGDGIGLDLSMGRGELSRVVMPVHEEREGVSSGDSLRGCLTVRRPSLSGPEVHHDGLMPSGHVRRDDALDARVTVRGNLPDHEEPRTLGGNDGNGAICPAQGPYPLPLHELKPDGGKVTQGYDHACRPRFRRNGDD